MCIIFVSFITWLVLIITKQFSYFINFFLCGKYSKIPLDDLKKVQTELKSFLLGEGKKEVVSNS